MKIDGKALAEAILSDVTTKVTALKEKGIVPTLAVILVGDNPESLAYIRQKQKATEKIGGRFIFEHLPKATTAKELAARVQMYNRDPAVHGLIVQRPIPGLTAHVDLAKDIDGFEKDSPHEVPIAMAIFTLLKDIEYRNKKIVVVGRGETAGKPIAEAFARRQCATSLIHSKTPNPKEIIGQLEEMLSEYNAASHENIIKRIAKFHLDFEHAHPFCDGNGRIGRVLNNYLLIREGFVPINIKFIDRKKYYEAFREYDAKGTAATMEEIVGKALTNSYYRRLAYLEGKKIITLADYAKQNKLSHSNLINKAGRQTIEAFLEKGVWKIGADFK